MATGRRFRASFRTAGAVLLALMLLPAAPACAAEPAKRPNVIFIVLDSARADHFSGYGYPKDTTPRMDRLAKEGAVFLNNFSQGSNSQTSVPSILSSRHYSLSLFPEDLSLWEIRRETPETAPKQRDAEQTFLPQILSAAGYRTAIVTDHHRIALGTELAGMFDRAIHFDTADQDRPDSSFGPILLAASRWIQDGNRTAGRPFFLYVHVLAPHYPFPPTVLDPRFLENHPPEEVDAVRRNLETSDQADGWSKKELGIYRALYDAKLRRADGLVGSILDAVDGAESRLNTLVVITGDHGENLGEHNELMHGGTQWDSVTHVPLILTLPVTIPAGSRIAALTESVDIVPTILELCGLSPPIGKSLDGISLKGLILGTAKGRDAAVSSDYIRTETHKYYPKSRFLADLKTDPGELNDIASREPETAASLLREWERRVTPSRRRYESAVSTAPQSSPFYFPVDTLRIEAADPLQSAREHRDPPWIAKRSTQSWLLADSTMEPALLALPQRARSGPLALSAPVPKGEYRISVAVVSPESSTGTLPSARYRFSGKGRFQAFEEITPLKRPWRETSLNYFLYRTRGWVRADERFGIELELPTELTGLWGVAHVRFEPRGSSQPPPTPAARPEEAAEIRRLMRERGYW